MKWFKHLSTAYSDIKIQDLLDEFGSEGYGIFWICCEIVASQGEDGFRIMSGQNWTNRVGKIAKIDEKKTSTIISFMADIGLIDKKSLSRGILSIPKLYKYADDTTQKVRRVVGQSPDNVLSPIYIYNNIKNILISERIRTDIKIIYLYAYHKNIKELSREQNSSYIRRNLRAAQLLKGYPTLRIGKVMEYLKENANFKWTLETVGKYIDEDLNKLKEKENNKDEVVKI